MVTFGMILLTLFTVLGSAMLGWLARRYALGGRCGPFGSDELASSLPGSEGHATGAIGTVAAGTAAFRYADDGSDGSGTVDKSSGSNGQSRALSSISGGATAAAAAVTAGVAGVAAKFKSGGSDVDATVKSSDSNEQSGVLASISKGAAAVTAGVSGVAAKLKSGDTDADGPNKSSDSGEQSGALASIDKGATTETVAAATDVAGVASKLESGESAGLVGVAKGASADFADAGSSTGSPDSDEDARGTGSTGGISAEDDSNTSAMDDEDDNSDALINIPAALSPEEAEAERLLASDDEIAAPSNRLDAPRSGTAPDDLTKIKGIGPKINGSLNERGIYYYDQIATFSGSDLAWADRELGFKGRAVRDRWIPQAQGLMDGTALQEGGSSQKSGAASPELEASHAEVRQLRKRLGLSRDNDGPASDPTKGNDARLEASQREARELRQQLWSKEEAEKAAAAKAQAAKAEADKAAAAKAEADKSAAAKKVEAGKAAAAKAEADRAAAAKAEAGKAVTAKAEYDKTAADSSAGSGAAAGTGIAAAAMMADFGALSADETEAERMIASGTAPKAASNKLDAPTPGFDPDDLTKIRGIGKPTRGRLNRHGIYYYDQIAGFTASDLAWADKEMNLEGRVVTDRWIPQAKLLAGESTGSGTGGNGAAAVDSQPVAVSAPAPAGLLAKPIDGRSPDDLKAIKGIGNVLQQQLNDKGIYYYSQIAEFSASDKEWADQSLGFPGRVERDEWIPQARQLMNTSAGAETGRAARLGALSNAGQQLESLSDDVEIGEMSNDETEAMRLIESGTFVADESNRPASLLQSASNGVKDDLQQIKGVGPKLEDLLNSLGIYYHRQIASFSATDIAWVDSKLRFKGRIVRDRWVDQAKRLN